MDDAFLIIALVPEGTPEDKEKQLLLNVAEAANRNKDAYFAIDHYSPGMNEDEFKAAIMVAAMATYRRIEADRAA